MDLRHASLAHHQAAQGGDGREGEQPGAAGEVARQEGGEQAAVESVDRGRAEPGVEGHAAYSMIIVPTNTPGYRIVRDTPVLGLDGGHCEVAYENVRVPVKTGFGGA